MKPLSICVVGDVVVDRPAPEATFARTAALFRAADLVSCQLETVYTMRTAAVPTPGRPLRADPTNVQALAQANFKLVSLAGNHCMDYGADGLADTIAHLRQAGIATVGAGKDLKTAMAPAIFEVCGTKVAWFSFNCIMPDATWATLSRAGCAPIRIHTHYQMVEPHQPGCPARVHTYPYTEDLEQAVHAVRSAKANADFVLVSIHWGLHFTPGRLAEYERPLAHALIDAGVDAIFGTHPHHLKAVEVYRQRVIAYSLGNFAFDLAAKGSHQSLARHKELTELYPMLADAPQAGNFPFPEASRLTLIECLELIPGRPPAVRFLPAYINADSVPELLNADDERTHQILRFIGPDCEALGSRMALQGESFVMVSDSWTSASSDCLAQ